jgi:hypothetical protein
LHRDVVNNRNTLSEALHYGQRSGRAGTFIPACHHLIAIPVRHLLTNAAEAHTRSRSSVIELYRTAARAAVDGPSPVLNVNLPSEDRADGADR